MERRQELRYRLEVPALFYWEGTDRASPPEQGITRNVSLQGAFILSKHCPRTDCPIRLDLYLPPIPGMKAILQISGRVKVVRINDHFDEKGAKGFAVSTIERRPWGMKAMQPDSDFQLIPEMCLALQGA